MFKYDVQKFIEEKALFGPKDKILVALSGGADSIALLCVLLSLGYSCECAHCNFHLRGEESNRDESFVRAFCLKHSVLLHVAHYDTKAYAESNHLSIEMAARKLRYDWFETLRKERKASVIATAHHRNDSVETFLLNLIRGTGINGLKGISPHNGHIVRPLLKKSRESILDYLQSIRQDYVTDSTNLQDEYTRNKIRLNILPLMKDINPSIIEKIDETSERLSEVANIYHQNRMETIAKHLIKESDAFFHISICNILHDIAPMSLLHEILSPLGFNSSQIRNIYNCLCGDQSGKRFETLDWEVLRDRSELIIRRKEVLEECPELIVEQVDITFSFKIPTDKCKAYIDADKVQFPLTLRKWESGDKFVPLGMTGKKKVSDYLTDKKYSLFQKESQYVVCSKDDIVWLVNERCDNRFRITNNTKKALVLQIKKGRV